jgi:hypothetical protein
VLVVIVNLKEKKRKGILQDVDMHVDLKTIRNPLEYFENVIESRDKDRYDLILK